MISPPVQVFETTCDSLDRAWFGEMWFPVEESVCQVQTVVSQASIPDPADLDMDSGCEEPDLCFSRSQIRDPAYALLDSGATHVLLPGHMLPKGARSFELTVNLAVGKEKAKCWRNEVYAQERASVPEWEPETQSVNPEWLEHHQSGHLTKDPNCPVCMEEAGSKINY